MDARQAPKIEQLLKKPIFTFLDSEIVKALKRFAMDPPASFTDGFGKTEQDKQKVLDGAFL